MPDIARPGDVVLAERPSYAVALQQLALAQARVVTVPGDADGLDPAALEAAVVEHRPKLIYTMPTFQNPGGSTIPAQRRAAIASLAERHGRVIEDGSNHTPETIAEGLGRLRAAVAECRPEVAAGQR